MELIEKHEPLSPGVPGDDAIAAYQRDGVVCLRSAFDHHWVEKGRRAVAAAIGAKSRSGQFSSHRESGERGSFFYDTFLWKRFPSFSEYTFQSPASHFARQVMQSESLLLYFDMAIVKEPGTSAETPWHYDEAYWPVSGSQVCNLWMALDHISEETALRFIAGSHKSVNDYAAVDFFTKQGKKNHPDQIPPQWDQIDGDHRILLAPMEPGDCAIFNFRTHHSAPGNLQRKNRRRAICTHWFGDDARFDDKAWECNPDERGENLHHGGPLECETFPRVY